METSSSRREKIVIFSGSGISAPSGIPTFRDHGGLWKTHRFQDLASPEAWARQPEIVLEFYNERRLRAAQAEPNTAHLAIAGLERRFEVVVVTQNVDDLHERAGSTQVIHLHGELRKARSTVNPSLVHDIGAAPIRLGDLCAEGGQLRPHIVWFGEEIMNHASAVHHIRTADKIVVVGTSLSVHPAAGLLKHVPHKAEKILVDLDASRGPYGYKVFQGSADQALPSALDSLDT